MSPSSTSALSRTRNNMHWFQAGSKGAVLLDFGIRFGKPGGGPKVVSSVEFDDQPLDPNTRIHTAKWIGNIYTKK